MKVRKAEKKDAAYLKKWLTDPAVLRYFPMLDEREIDDSIRIWMGYIPQGAALTITDEKQIPVGMGVIYVHTYEKLKHQALFAVIVDGAQRGRGYGTTLYREMEKRAKKLGVTLLHLEVYEGNPAQRLYERLGFEYYGRHEKFLKEPSGQYIAKIGMQKKI